MTTKPDPVVEALDSIDRILTAGGYTADSSARHQLAIARSLSKELVEYKEGLEWLLRRFPITFTHVENMEGCPATIKRLIEEKT